MKKTSYFMLSCLSVLSLAACSTNMEKEFDENARYWQRVDTTDAIYQQGPKAQQMLFQDMANCTAVVDEMQRLGAIKDAVPAETFDQNGMKIDPLTAEGRLARYETPERDGYMRTEMYDFTDFEGCMNHKGWERVKYVNYKTVDRSRKTYLENMGVEQYRTRIAERSPKAEYNE